MSFPCSSSQNFYLWQSDTSESFLISDHYQWLQHCYSVKSGCLRNQCSMISNGYICLKHFCMKNITVLGPITGLETVLYYFIQNCFRHTSTSITSTQSLKGFIIHLNSSWTVSAQWVHSKRTASARWAEFRLRLWTVNWERTQSANASAKWTLNDICTLCERKMVIIRSAPGGIVTLCFVGNQEIITINYMFVLL